MGSVREFVSTTVVKSLKSMVLKGLIFGDAFAVRDLALSLWQLWVENFIVKLLLWFTDGKFIFLIVLTISLKKIEIVPSLLKALDVKTIFGEDTVKFTILLAFCIKRVNILFVDKLLNKSFNVLFQDKFSIFDFSESFKFDLFFIMTIEKNIWHPLSHHQIKLETIDTSEHLDEKADTTISDEQRRHKWTTFISLESNLEYIDAQEL